MAAVGIKIPLIAPGIIFGPIRFVDRRSQDVRAEAEHTDCGIKPCRLALPVNESDDNDDGKEAGGAV